MSNKIEVVCPKCDTVNRVIIDKMENSICGRCHAKLFQKTPIHLDEKRFDKHLTKNQLPILVDFWAPWCPPCHMIAPVLEELSKQMSLRLRIIKIDTDQNKELAIKYKIRSIPTLILFKNGQEVSRLTGAHDYADIYSWVNRYLFDS